MKHMLLSKCCNRSYLLQCENKISIHRRPVAGHKRLQRSSASSISAQVPLPQIALQKTRYAMMDSLDHLFISWRLNHPAVSFYLHYIIIKPSSMLLSAAVNSWWACQRNQQISNLDNLLLSRSHAAAIFINDFLICHLLTAPLSPSSCDTIYAQLHVQ